MSLTIDGQVSRAMIYLVEARLETPRLLGQDAEAASVLESPDAEEHASDSDDGAEEEAA
jgi:hypothetical protein